MWSSNLQIAGVQMSGACIYYHGMHADGAKPSEFGITSSEIRSEMSQIRLK